MKIGFIGLGNMGSAMSMNLLRAGHNVTVYNRTAQKAKPLLDQGARAAADPAEASRADVVFTMLADDHAVESVIFGESGILAHLQPGSIHISSSTISVALSEKLAAAHEKTEPAVYCCSGFRTTGSRSGRKVDRCRCWPYRCDRPLRASV